MNNKFSVGLDIGTTKIVAMVGEKNQFNKIKVLGVDNTENTNRPTTRSSWELGSREDSRQPGKKSL